MNTGGAGGTGGMAPDPNCPPEPASPTPLANQKLKLTEITSNVSRPDLLIGAPGDTSRLYVLESTGAIRIIKDGTLLPAAFLDVSALSIIPSGSSEQGLLGLVFHPKYATNGRFFIYYTRKGDGFGVLAEYSRSAGNPDVANPDPVKTLITVEDFAGNHNGGNLAFGKDGYLYLGVGDGGGGDDPQKTGQDLTRKLGKILRIDVDKYPTPPPGNLPVQNGSDPDIWDWGLRNPWRFSFDRCTGDLYIGDVGQKCWEEVDVEPAGQGQKNYGWSVTEGNNHCEIANNTQCTDSQNCDMTGITMPVIEYTHGGGRCSVTGGFVYRGTKIPDLVGVYFYADYCTNQIWALRWKNGAVVEQAELSTELMSTSLVQGVSSFGQDTEGELYVVGLNGQIFRIEAE